MNVQVERDIGHEYITLEEDYLNKHNNKPQKG